MKLPGGCSAARRYHRGKWSMVKILSLSFRVRNFLPEENGESPFAQGSSARGAAFCKPRGPAAAPAPLPAALGPARPPRRCQPPARCRCCPGRGPRRRHRPYTSPEDGRGEVAALRVDSEGTASAYGLGNGPESWEYVPLLLLHLSPGMQRGPPCGRAVQGRGGGERGARY